MNAVVVLLKAQAMKNMVYFSFVKEWQMGVDIKFYERQEDGPCLL